MLRVKAAEEHSAAFSATLDDLHNLVNAKEVLLEQAAKLTKDQADAIAAMTRAQLKNKESIAALEFRLTEALTMHTHKEQTITDMQVVENRLRDSIPTLAKQAEKDADGLADCWKKICVKGGAAENYEGLWRRGTKSRKLEQDAAAQVQLELTEALGTINRLQSEAHDTSMEDTILEQHQSANSSKILVLLDFSSLTSSLMRNPRLLLLHTLQRQQLQHLQHKLHLQLHHRRAAQKAQLEWRSRKHCLLNIENLDKWYWLIIASRERDLIWLDSFSACKTSTIASGASSLSGGASRSLIWSYNNSLKHCSSWT